MKNIGYAGSLVAILDIDMPTVEELADRALRRQESAAGIESQGLAPGV